MGTWDNCQHSRRQQHFQPASQSHARCVIQWLLSEGVLWSTRPPALHNSVFIPCNNNVDRGLTANTGKDTYRHDQLKWVLVHPHRWLIFLHHGGDYSNTNDLNRDKDNTKWLEKKERGLIKYKESENSWDVGLRFFNLGIITITICQVPKMTLL